MEHKQDINHEDHLIRGGDHDEYATKSTEEEVTFLHDFIAGGIAGSASVVVGHPFDTIKVSAIMVHISLF
jgi:solute carrier family 25 carnitine/acylcarnitine transporter 20/29